MDLDSSGDLDISGDLDSSGDLSSRSICKYDFHLEVQRLLHFSTKCSRLCRLALL
jgi:hypothetical protein